MNYTELKRKLADFDYSLACADNLYIECTSEIDFCFDSHTCVDGGCYWVANEEDFCDIEYFCVYDHDTREFVQFPTEILES